LECGKDGYHLPRHCCTEKTGKPDFIDDGEKAFLPYFVAKLGYGAIKVNVDMPHEHGKGNTGYNNEQGHNGAREEIALGCGPSGHKSCLLRFALQKHSALCAYEIVFGVAVKCIIFLSQGWTWISCFGKCIFG
jgi:hypothetical protein